MNQKASEESATMKVKKSANRRALHDLTDPTSLWTPTSHEEQIKWTKSMLKPYSSTSEAP
jgi:hypothetical protein